MPRNQRQGNAGTSICVAFLVLFVILSPYLVWTRTLSSTDNVFVYSRNTFSTSPLIASYSASAVTNWYGWGYGWSSFSLWYSDLVGQTSPCNMTSNSANTLWISYFCQNGQVVLPADVKNIQITLWVTFVAALVGGLLGCGQSRCVNLLAGFITLGAFVSSVLSLTYIGNFGYYQDLRSTPPQTGLLVPGPTSANPYFVAVPQFGFSYGPSFYVLIVSCILLFFVSLSMFAAAKSATAANDDLTARYDPELEKDPVAVDQRDVVAQV